MVSQNEMMAVRLDGETTEGLMLMAVLGRDTLKTSALRELNRRKAMLAQEQEFCDLYMTNLSVVAC